MRVRGHKADFREIIVNAIDRAGGGNSSEIEKNTPGEATERVLHFVQLTGKSPREIYT